MQAGRGEAVRRTAIRGGQQGYTLAAVLILMMVLTALGSVALMKVRGDIKYTSRDILQIKSKSVAESAVNWALASLAVERPGVLAFTAATHSITGVDTLPDFLGNGDVNPRKLHSTDVVRIYGGSAVRYDSEGWIYQETTNPAHALTKSKSELIAFRVWYPNDTTIRVSGKAVVDGVATRVEMTGNMKYTPVGI